MQGKLRFIRVLTLVLLAFILSVESSEGKSVPTAKQGHMNLDQWEFQQEGMVQLDGEWEFYWEEFLVPADFDAVGDGIEPYYMEVPHAWYQSTMNGKRLPHEGYATYRLTIDLHEDERGQLMSVYIPRVYSAHKIWINGELLHEQGVVGENRLEMQPDDYTQGIPFKVNHDSIEIVIQVSNFTQRAGGVWDSIQLGTEADISSFREGRIIETWFFVGSLTIIGCVFICFYLFRRKNRSPLYFGILCIAIGVQTFLWGEKFPSLGAQYWNWTMGYKLEYLVNTIALGSFSLFINDLYPQEMKKRVTQAILTFCVSYGLLVAMTPPHIFSYTMIYFQLVIITSLTYILYALIKAAIRLKRGALLQIAGFSVLFITLILDILYYNQIASEETLLNYGMFFYIFMQSLHLSRVFAESYTRIEYLSSELLSLNTSLEEKIKARTQTIREKNTDLSQKEALRRRMMTNISHELSSPLTSIRGYMKGMLDGVFPRGDEKYIQLVYDKALLLERSIKDLQDLSKLENQQISFLYDTVDIRTFVRNLYEKYEDEVTESGREFIYQDFSGDAGHSLVKIDPERIEQVFSNLLRNARKHTPENTEITVELDIDKENAVISMIDSGGGIEEKDLSHLFHRFDRKTSSDGFGIGLAICKEIIEQHDGKIAVESSLDIGSRFYFKLPLEKDD